MKLEEKDLVKILELYNQVKKNKCNVLDQISEFNEDTLLDLVCRYVVFVFDSCDYLKNKNVDWDEFYTLIKDNIGKSQSELFSILFDKYGLAF